MNASRRDLRSARQQKTKQQKNTKTKHSSSKETPVKSPKKQVTSNGVKELDADNSDRKKVSSARRPKSGKNKSSSERNGQPEAAKANQSQACVIL